MLSWSSQVHSRNVFGQGMSLVQRLWNPGCEVRKSLSPRHQSGCAKDNNRYNVLSMEEIKESKDSLDNKTISNSTLPSEGSPSGLSRNVKPGLKPSNKNNKNIMKERIPGNMFMHSIRPAWEIYLSIQITLASSWNNFMKLDVLLDLGTNAIFIDKAWAKKHKVPLMPLHNPIPVYNIDGMWNSTGSITHAVELIVKFQGHCEKIMAEVMDLGKNTFILGFSWLKWHTACDTATCFSWSQSS